MPRKENDLKALRDMIGEAHDILRTVVLPEERSRRAYELLTASLQLADHLLEISPAATLGAKGGIDGISGVRARDERLQPVVQSF